MTNEESSAACKFEKNFVQMRRIVSALTCNFLSFVTDQKTNLESKTIDYRLGNMTAKFNDVIE